MKNRLIVSGLVTGFTALVLTGLIWYQSEHGLVAASRSIDSEILKLVDKISPNNKVESREAVVALAELDKSYTQDLINALLSSTDRANSLVEQIEQTSLTETRQQQLIDELEKTSWQKNQLIVLLGHRSDPRIVGALIRVAAETHPESLEHATISVSLASQGPSPEIREYFLELVTNEKGTVQQKRGAIGYLSENPDSSDQEVVDQLLQEVDDPKLLGAVIFWGAKIKPRSDMRQVIADHLKQSGLGRNGQYLPLFALAEVANPHQFDAIVANLGLSKWIKERARRLSEFNHASPSEKEALIRGLLSSGDTEEWLAVLKFMLANNRTDLLQRYVVKVLPGVSEDGLMMSRRMKRLVTLAGYKLRVEGDELIIDKR